MIKKLIKNPLGIKHPHTLPKEVIEYQQERLQSPAMGLEQRKYKYCFTPDERAGLEDVLKSKKQRLEPSKQEALIKCFEHYCSQRKIMLDNATAYDNRKKILARCQDALMCLQQVSQGQICLENHPQIKNKDDRAIFITLAEFLPDEAEHIKFKSEKPYEYASVFNSVMTGHAKKALQPLQHFADLLGINLKASHSKRGRKTADSTAFIKNLADAYEKHAGTKPKASGHFADLVCYCLEILGLKHEEPRRAIQAALKKS